ncbi:MAG: hypothetical protein QXE42_02085 [Candidatus Aenigmatarchaeota archaeon]
MEEYDIETAKRVINLLKNNPRGLDISEISRELKISRNTAIKVLERLLIEKRIDYVSKGPAKIFFLLGESKFVGRIDLSDTEKIWIDVIYPMDEKYGEKLIRLNQTKLDYLSRSSSKFRSVGAIIIDKKNMVNLVRLLRDIAKNEFGLEI